VSRYIKPIWILLKQETVSGSGISCAICKSAPRSRHTTMPAPHHLVAFYTFYTGQMPFLPPNQQRRSTEGIMIIIIMEPVYILCRLHFICCWYILVSMHVFVLCYTRRMIHWAFFSFYLLCVHSLSAHPCPVSHSESTDSFWWVQLHVVCALFSFICSPFEFFACF